MKKYKELKNKKIIKHKNQVRLENIASKNVKNDQSKHINIDDMAKTNKQYLVLHYKILNYYRNKYGKYISFKAINRNIQRQWQIIQYYENNNQVDEQINNVKIKWCENLVQEKTC
jgi:hypothetical protein